MNIYLSDSNLEWFARGVSEIFPWNPQFDSIHDNFIKRLSNPNPPLRVKLGIDPTGSEIHLGHSIAFRKLRAFQDAGHTAVIIIGDFTARIGDPTGKSEVRTQLTQEQVINNARSYLDQIRPIIDFDTPGRLEIRYNSEWLSNLDLTKILELLSTMTVGQMLAKEGFSQRYDQGNPIYLHEFLYPLMQGYDSVAVHSDIELGGTDQKFNIAVGRDLQRIFGQSTQWGILMPILIGRDGTQKMSKSLNNYVGLLENASSMYSKLQKIPDHLVEQYFELLTNIPRSQLPPDNRLRQKLLALTITAQYHGQEAANQAQLEIESLLSEGDPINTQTIPEFSINQITFPIKLSVLLKETGLVASNSDGRRQIQGGALRLGGDRINDPNFEITEVSQIQDKVLRLGKAKFIRLV